jgi:hypothetical protein
VTTAAIQTFDSNHLTFGVSAEGREIEPDLIKTAASYFNVFSAEHYAHKTGLDEAVDGVNLPYLPVEQTAADLEARLWAPL